jgi:hypothetical protein
VQVLEQGGRIERRGFGKAPEGRQPLVQRAGIALGDGAYQPTLALEVVRIEFAHEPKVHDADAAVAAEQQVVRGGVAGRDPAPPDQPKDEAKRDLSDAVTLTVVELRGSGAALRADREDSPDRRGAVYLWSASPSRTAAALA